MDNRKGRGERGEGRENVGRWSLIVGRFRRAKAQAVFRYSSFVILFFSLAFLCNDPKSLLAAEPSVKKPPQVYNMTAVEKAELVESMSPAAKADLLRKEKSFRNLDADEQKNLRRLHQEIQKDRDAEELRRIMRNYYEWWKSLPLNYRAELSSLSSPQERVKRIKQLKQEELKRNTAKILSEKDTEALLRWMEEYAEKNQAQFLKKLSPEQNNWLSGTKPEMRTRWIMFLIWQRWQGRGNIAPSLSEIDLDELRSRLTPETQKRLKEKSPSEQSQIMQSWLWRVAMQQMAPRRGRGPGGIVDEERLEEFFEKEITSEQRDRLLNFPPEEMQHELKQLYWLHKKPLEPPSRRSDGPSPRGPRGNPERMRPNNAEKTPEKTQ